MTSLEPNSPPRSAAVKAAFVIVGLALIAFVVVAFHPDEPGTVKVPSTSRGPSFEVHVVKPLSARPLFGLLPGGYFGLPPSEVRFDSVSPGAQVGRVEPNRLELRADGWDLIIETDGEGRIAPRTQLVFPLELAEKQRTLRCRPAPQASGYLRTTARKGSSELDGSFLVELSTCENVATGKTIGWPPAPLTVRGSFEGLQQGSH